MLYVMTWILDIKFTEGLDMVNICVDELLRAMASNTPATTNAMPSADDTSHNTIPPAKATANDPHSPVQVSHMADVVPEYHIQSDGRQASVSEHGHTITDHLGVPERQSWSHQDRLPK